MFPQYIRVEGGELTDMPNPGIDTGAGLERILGVLADSPSLYAADTLSVLTDRAQQVTGKRFGADRLSDVALRLIADHTRTVAFLISDGVMPSNEDRGYVLRRVMRRAVYFSYLLGVEKPVLPPMIETCVELMGDAYPDLAANADSVLTIVSREEARFRQTLKTGSAMLDTELDKLGDGEGRVLDGAVAFQLHDTYGFPLEVTQEILPSGASTSTSTASTPPWPTSGHAAKAGAKGGTVAIGDEVDAFRPDPRRRTARPSSSAASRTRATTTVVGVVPGTGDLDDTVSIFLARRRSTPSPAARSATPARSAPPPAGPRCSTPSTPCPACTATWLRIVEGAIEVGDEATATIDVERRNAIRRHHTGTHILHWALREVLGDHVKQQGSLVEPDRLRFDFSHFEALTPEQITAIEDLANHEILGNAPVRHYETTKDEAREQGRHRLLRRQVRRHRPGARGRRALASSCAAAPTSTASATSARSRSWPKSPSGPTCGASTRSPAPARSTGCASASASSPRWPTPPACPSPTWSTASPASATSSRRLRTRSRGCAARPRRGGPPNWRPTPSTASWSPRSTASTATICATWPRRCATSPASGSWCWAARPKAAARPWSWPPPTNPASTPATCSATPRSSSRGADRNDPRLVVAGGKNADGVGPALDAVRATLGAREVLNGRCVPSVWTSARSASEWR